MKLSSMMHVSGAGHGGRLDDRQSTDTVSGTMPFKMYANLLGRQPTTGNREPQGAQRRSWTGTTRPTSLSSCSSGASSVDRRFVMPPSGSSRSAQKQASGQRPGKPPSRPPAGWSMPGAGAAPIRNSSKLRRPPDSPPSPYDEEFPGGSGDPDLDALDGLLRQASASLKKINRMREQRTEQITSQPHLPKRRGSSNNFWKPRCRSDLWNVDEDCWDFDDSDVESESSQGSSVGFDVEEEELWDFLRKACGADLSGMRSGAAGNAPEAAAGAAAAAAHDRSEATEDTGYSRPKEFPSTGRAGGKHTKVDGTPLRGDTGGFRFGTYAENARRTTRLPQPSGFPEVHAPSPTPEGKVTATLAAAKAQGPDAVRRAIKELLLKWHPDKASQGDSPEAVAARAESTRVLRHVLQERKRLGL